MRPLELQQNMPEEQVDNGALKPTDPNKEPGIQFSFGRPSMSQNNDEALDQGNQVESQEMKTTEDDQMISSLKRSLEKKKQVAIQSMRQTEGLICPICMDMIISCRIAICGHSFCHQCISECMLRKKECPQCRKNIRKKVLQPSSLIDNSVKMHVYGKKKDGDADAFNKWKERMLAYFTWVDSIKLKNVKVGEQIDACDTENIWCKATIELVVKTASRKDLLYIHYEGWNRKYDEYLYIDSHRIAPLGVMTLREDIPVYRMMGNRNPDGQLNMMYAVVLSNAAEEVRLQEQERRQSAVNVNPNDENDDDDDDDDQEDNPVEDNAASEDLENRSNLQAQFDVSIENVNAQLSQRRLNSVTSSLPQPVRESSERESQPQIPSSAQPPRPR